MEVKFGKLRPNNLCLNPTDLNSDENFFTSKTINITEAQQENKLASGNRINDYDSNILENNAYREINDEMFKIEHKISLLENNLSKINDEINALESLGAYIQISDLKDRKRKIEEELNELNKKYSELGISTKIAGQISTVLNFKSKKRFKIFPQIQNFIYKKILIKISRKFNYSQVIKEALTNLSSINSSVNELIKMQVPYGETENRYEKLTTYLNKANTIHSKISHNVNAITNS